MLRYQINAQNIISETQNLNPIFVKVEDYGFDDYLVATIMHDGTHVFNAGEKVSFQHKIKVDSKAHKRSIETVYYDEYTIMSSDQNSNMFSINVAKDFSIGFEAAELDFLNPNDNVLFIKFSDYHYFSFGEECKVSITYSEDDEDFTETISCDFVDEYTLKWVFDIGNDVHGRILNHFFKDGIYYQTGANINVVQFVSLNSLPDPVLFTSPEFVLVAANPNIGMPETMYFKSNGSFAYNDETFKRENFLFGEYDDVTILVNSPSFAINIPLFQNFDTKTYRDVLINEKLTTDVSKSAIVEMSSIEKDVYYPVLIDEYRKTHFAKKLVFNLHFRKRDLSEGWSTPSDENFWNGTNDNDPQYPCLSNAAYYDQQTQAMSPFISNRSDLLSKIGFTDNDVKYQKSRLTKSFLRLMYYTNTNPATQQLVGYSTIFMDGGNLLSKFIKYSNSKDYYKPKEDNSQQYISYPGFPISVTKEPFQTDGLTDAGEFESMRLSTQFVVSDRFLSKSSSEGFYIYLYKDYSSELPKDLYMKVEFNHAGYGKKIPFFMPSFILSVDMRRGIKTYEDILNDWTEQTPQTPYGYGYEKYNAYSYIHLKYRYDFETKKHTYYLDDEYYGTDVLYDGKSEITINLYEPKVIL